MGIVFVIMLILAAVFEFVPPIQSRTVSFILLLIAVAILGLKLFGSPL